MTERAPEDTFDPDDLDDLDLAPELDLEAPEPDALEQHTGAGRTDTVTRRASVPLEADPADTAEQDQVVPEDDDDYR
ncbi:MAG: hypothetical protein M3P83_13460 [Actinomycetota bacterium]|nr:hypothetical protein [Actinomycetota bacterium]